MAERQKGFVTATSVSPAHCSNGLTQAAQDNGPDSACFIALKGELTTIIKEKKARLGAWPKRAFAPAGEW